MRRPAPDAPGARHEAGHPIAVVHAPAVLVGEVGPDLPALQAQRKCQFYLDFVEAENSVGFHAPQEAARILGESINFARKGQEALRGLPSRRDALRISQMVPDVRTPESAKWMLTSAR